MNPKVIGGVVLVVAAAVIVYFVFFAGGAARACNEQAVGELMVKVAALPEDKQNEFAAKMDALEGSVDPNDVQAVCEALFKTAEEVGIN